MSYAFSKSIKNKLRFFDLSNGDNGTRRQGDKLTVSFWHNGLNDLKGTQPISKKPRTRHQGRPLLRGQVNPPNDRRPNEADKVGGWKDRQEVTDGVKQSRQRKGSKAEANERQWLGNE